MAALVLAGCGSDTATTTTTTTPGPTSPAPAPLIPEVACTGAKNAVYFAYENQSDVPVIVPLGDANRFTAIETANPLTATLFAPGRVDAAFWVYPELLADSSQGPITDISWSLTGPDGVERTARVEADTPPCADDYLAGASTDTRTPAIRITEQGLSGAGDSLHVELELTGVGDLSVCNPAFQAEPVFVSLDSFTELPTSFEPTLTLDLPFGPNPDPTRGGQLAQSSFWPLVIDQCSFDGTTVSSWPVSPAFADFVAPDRICGWLADGGTLSIGDEYCVAPPFTGGSQIRPG